jgi:branched-chain amino acid transport system ATP-binding protein
MTIPALAVSSLSARYVHDVSLRVAPSEAAALLGPNGVGKTTVLRAIMGLVRDRKGSCGGRAGRCWWRSSG